MKFGEKLQNLRKASSLSQEQLADKLNVSRQAVSKWESNASYPEMDKLIAMCKLFKCSMDDLVNDEVKDKEIITKKETSSINNYVIDFINFFIESFNMIFSMKFTSLLKMVVELFIIGAILFFGVAIGISLLIQGIYEPLIYRFGYLTIIEIIFITIIIFLTLFFIIIYIQIYKNRYLNYYLKEKYKNNQINDLNIKEPTEENKKFELKEEKFEFKNREPKFIIKNNNSSSFMGTLLQILTIFSKAFIVVFIAPFVILAFIFAVIGLVISIYLILSNFLFFGITILFIGVIAILELILEFIYKFLINKRINTKRFGITFLISFIIIGLGFGLSIIKFNDFEVKNASRVDKYSKTFTYSDNLNISINNKNTILFTIDNNIKDVKIDIEYNKNRYEVNTLENDYKNFHFIDIDFKYLNNDNDNIIYYLNTFIDNLKDNIIQVDNDYYETTLTITSNEEQIINIIKNLSKTNRIEVYERNKGYMVSVADRITNDDVCTLNKKGYYECILVVTDNFCEYSVDSYNRIIEKDKKNCECIKHSEDFYSCKKKELSIR